MNQKDRKRLRKACDKLWADITKIIHKKKHGSVCLWCKKKTNKLQSDHVFNRWKTATRWNPSNCVVLCMPCHLFRKKREPIAWADMVKEEIPTETYEELKIVSNQECKPDLLTIKMFLEGILRNLRLEALKDFEKETRNKFLVKDLTKPETGSIV